MALSSHESLRYHRHIIAPEIGQRGQEKLLASSVLIVGCGGLGSASASYLCAAGFGRIGLLDRDTVELSNLQRQIIHKEQTIGMPKASSGAIFISGLNSRTIIDEHNLSLDDKSADEIFPYYDCIVDGTDNLETRYIINHSALKAGKPAVMGAINSFSGQITTVVPGKSPCYNCLFPKGRVLSSGPVPVVSPLPGIIGSLEAIEAIKLALGMEENCLLGRLLSIDCITIEFDMLKYYKNPKCPECGKG